METIVAVVVAAELVVLVQILTITEEQEARALRCLVWFMGKEAMAAGVAMEALYQQIAERAQIMDKTMAALVL